MPIPDFTAAIVDAQSETNRLRAMSMRERAELIEAACRGAVELEISRGKMGLRPSEPAPWPDSTWSSFREWSRRVREAT